MLFFITDTFLTWRHTTEIMTFGIRYNNHPLTSVLSLSLSLSSSLFSLYLALSLSLSCLTLVPRTISSLRLSSQVSSGWPAHTHRCGASDQDRAGGHSAQEYILRWVSLLYRCNLETCVGCRFFFLLLQFVFFLSFFSFPILQFYTRVFL